MFACWSSFDISDQEKQVKSKIKKAHKCAPNQSSLKWDHIHWKPILLLQCCRSLLSPPECSSCSLYLFTCLCILLTAHLAVNTATQNGCSYAWLCLLSLEQTPIFLTPFPATSLRSPLPPLFSLFLQININNTGS